MIGNEVSHGLALAWWAAGNKKKIEWGENAAVEDDNDNDDVHTNFAKVFESAKNIVTDNVFELERKWLSELTN